MKNNLDNNNIINIIKETNNITRQIIIITIDIFHNSHRLMINSFG